MLYQLMLDFSVTDKVEGYEMTGHPRNMAEHSPTSFLDCVYQDDREAFLGSWQKLTIAKEEVTMEYAYLLS